MKYLNILQGLHSYNLLQICLLSMSLPGNATRVLPTPKCRILSQNFQFAVLYQLVTIVQLIKINTLRVPRNINRKLI